jgi:hypothetical protein
MLQVVAIPPFEYAPYRLVLTPALTVRMPSALVAAISVRRWSDRRPYSRPPVSPGPEAPVKMGRAR